MPVFKTLLVADEPRVLLVGADPWLIARVSAVFANHEMRVTALSSREFLKVDTANVDASSVYKVIWWLDFGDPETAQAIKANLAGMHNIPLVVLGRLPEQFLFDQERPSPELTAQQQFFEALPTDLPAAQLFFSRDMMTEDELREPLRLAFRGESQHRLLDPEEKWFFSSQDSFFQIISSTLTQPHLPRHVVARGRGAMSSTLLRKCADLLERYYGIVYEIVPVLARRSAPKLTGFVEAVSPIETGQLLDGLIRNKASWEQGIEILSSPLPAQSGRQAKSADAMGGKAALSSQEDLALGQIKKRINEGKRLVNRAKLASENLAPQQEEQIEGELARIFQNKRSTQKEERIGDKVKIVRKIAKKSRKNKALFFGGMAALSLGGIILLLWGVFAVTTALARREIYGFLNNISVSAAVDYAPGSWANALNFQAGIYQQALGLEWLGEGGELAAFQSSLSRFQAEKQALAALSNQYFLGLLGRGETSPEFPPALTEKITTLGRAESELIQAGEGLLPETGEIAAQQTWLEVLKSEQQELVLFTQLPEAMTAIFGGDGKRVYAVLLQNNLELRPTGGFIQAVGLLVFDQGLLIDSQVVNAYDLDSRLPGAIASPVEIKKYLGEDTWYLRDSNWSPDFPQAALRAAWFVREATGIAVDGVWAINYLALEQILEATGPLELPAYNETLTHNNLLERVEFHSDDELAQPGVNQGYAFAVFAQLLRQLQEFPPEQAGQFLQALGSGLKTKQVLLQFTDKDQQEALRKMGWGGEIVNPACPQQFAQENCLVDQVFQVEANIGLNRVNGYIKREVTHSIDLSGEKVSHKRTVTFKNTAHSDGWPLGAYKAYIRFILDGEAQPTNVTINGQKIAGDRLMIYGEEGRRVIGVPVEIPQQATATLELTYTTEKIPQDSFSFLLFDQKQSGIEATPTTITLHNPDQKAVLIAPKAELFGDSLEFKLTQDNHLFVGASFQ